MGNGELGAMKQSHRDVEHTMETIIKLIANIEETEVLESDEHHELAERTEELASDVTRHLENEEAAARMTDRLFSGRPLDVEQLGEGARQMKEVIEQFRGAVDELEDDIDVDDRRWQNARDRFDEFVESLRECSRTEWLFYSHYSTLLEPGGISS